MTLARQIPWHRASKLDLRSIFRGGVDGAIFGAQDPNVLLTRRNLLVNTAFAGAVAGTPGTAPTNWTLAGTGGTTAVSGDTLTFSVAGAARQFISFTAGVVLRPGETYRATVEITAVSGDPTDIVAYLSTSSGSVTGQTYVYVSNGVGRKTCQVTAGASGATVTLRLGCGTNGNTVGATSVSLKEPQVDKGAATEYQPVLATWDATYLADSRHDRVVQWQESTGVTPVMVAETACGLRMDNSRSLVRGAELVANGGFSTDLTGWTVTGAWAQSGGAAVKSGGSTATLSQSILTIGKTYEISVDVTAVSGTVLVYAGSGIQVGMTTVATHTFRLVCSGDTNLYLQCLTTSTGTVGNISVREVPGNHSLQATAAARPVVSQRVNIGVLTRNLAVQASGTPTSPAAVWAYNPTHGNAVTNNTAVGPDGVATASTLTFVAAGTYAIFALYSGLTVGVQYTFSIKVKLGTATNFCITANNNVAWDTMTGEREFTTADGLSTTGWKTVSITTTAVATSIAICLGRHSETGLAQQTVGTAFVCDHDLRLASDALFNIPAYQYVNTATDYDTVGFPAYERFDGVDDNRASSTGGGSTTGFFWCGVVTVLGGAGTSRVLFGDSGAGTGTYIAVTSGNALQFGVGAGVVNNLSTLAVGSSYVVTVWHESGIGYLQLDNGAISSGAVSPVAGTAQFTEGKTNNAASGFFNGRMYGRVYTKNYCPSANLRERIKRELARRAGCLHLLA